MEISQLTIFDTLSALTSALEELRYAVREQ